MDFTGQSNTDERSVFHFNVHFVLQYAAVGLHGAGAGDVVIITGDEHPVNAELAGLRQNRQQLLHQSRRFRTKVGFTPAQPRGSPSPGAPHPQTAPG